MKRYLIISVRNDIKMVSLKSRGVIFTAMSQFFSRFLMRGNVLKFDYIWALIHTTHVVLIRQGDLVIFGQTHMQIEKSQAKWKNRLYIIRSVTDSRSKVSHM